MLRGRWITAAAAVILFTGCLTKPPVPPASGEEPPHVPAAQVMTAEPVIKPVVTPVTGAEQVMKALSLAYDQIGPAEFRDGDWAVPVDGVYFYYAEGRLLPAELRKRFSEYDPQDFYSYPAELPPWKVPSEEDAVRFRAIEEERRSTPPNRSPLFFDALYRARTGPESWDRAKNIGFLGRGMWVHHSIVIKLYMVEQRILREAKTNTALQQWVDSIKRVQSWNWREVRGAQSRSHHAYGAAIDIIPKASRLKEGGELEISGGLETYWLWAANRGVEWWAVPYNRRYHPPEAVIAAFEHYGFIWGGKWDTYDTMHFEYRPELFILNQ
jgi:hypothetical protein